MFGNINLKTEIVNGTCPTCTCDTLLVSVAQDRFRCITCGTDLKQHINGKKKPLYGVSNYKKDQPRKRPGRHKKRLNKHEKRMKKKN